jgi:serine/threonine-protein kinase
MTVTPGTRIGNYEIIAHIGQGGMGEVWRASDTRLKRQVALKVLPAAFVTDPERIARFQREAEVLAALNHPNIAQIYGIEEGDGATALVLELVEGPTLADRIAQKPIPVDEALPIAKQIAEALEAAHEQGIIHRDLKPANIKVRDDGTIKVLDFGLAKLAEPAVASAAPPVSPLTQSPTITSPAMMTGVGVLLGTAAYMSPEQAKGRPADKRSDIWAFGCVLYEMLTGKGAFDGDDVADTLASVLRAEPEWPALPPNTPVTIRKLLRRCLVKDRKQRLSDAAVIRLEIADALEEQAAGGIPAGTATTPSRSRRASGILLVTSATLAAVIAGGTGWILRGAPEVPVVARFSFQPLGGEDLRVSSRTTVAVSRDGSKFAYVAASQGSARIFVRSVGELASHGIQGTESSTIGPMLPTFGPDGESIAFFDAGGGSDGWELKKVAIASGVPTTITTTGEPQGLDWGPDGIVFADTRGIQRVSPGGNVSLIVMPADGERLLEPQMLPDRKTVLFTIRRESLTGEGQVVAQSLVDGARRVLVEDGSDGRYLTSGHLAYSVGGTIFAMPVDSKTLAKKGEALPIIIGVRRGYQPGPLAETQLAVSATGTLVYLPGPATGASGLSDLMLGADANEPGRLAVKPAAYVQPRVSPDGRMLAVGRNDGPASDIWLYDLSGKTEIRRLTFGGKSRFPVWSPDSKRVTFQSALDGDAAIFWQAIEGGKPERLTKPVADETHVPEAWSRDGHLLFSIVKGSRHSLWVLTISDRKVERFGNVESSAPLSASFSPDNRWVAYGVGSRTQGLLSQDRGVFVEPFPPTGEKHQAPKTAIDFHPVWSPDGSSIFYVSFANQPLVSVPVSTTGASISFGTPKTLSRAPRPPLSNGAVRGYDVLRDGRMSVSPSAADTSSETSTNEIRIVLNWFEELKARVPTK